MKDTTTSKKPSISVSLRNRFEKIREEEKKEVTGIFRFHECPGGHISIPMKKYAGPVRYFNFKDGEQYTIPLWAARWLNGYDMCAVERKGKIDSCGYKIHKHAIDRVSGQPLIQVGEVRRRMGFESTEFMAV